MKTKREKITYTHILNLTKEKTKCILLTTENEFNEQITNGVRLSDIGLLFQCHCGDKYNCKTKDITKNGRPIIECEVCRKTNYKYKKIIISDFNDFLKPHKLYIQEDDDNIESSTNLDIYCSEGHTFSKTYNALKTHPICPYCSGEILTYEYIKEYIEETTTLLTTKEEFEEQCKDIDNINQNIKLKIKCCHCEDFYLSTFQVYKARKYCLCDKCRNIQIRKEKLENFKEEALANGQEILAEEYINYFTPIEAKCSCGQKYFISKNQFDKNVSNNDLFCPNCKPYGSKGEVKIQEYLVGKMSFSKEYIFHRLFGINGGLVRFDFAIFDNKNKLKLLIEYDGEQHYYPVNFGGISDEDALINFSSTIYNDALKNSYCEDNNIPLLRIPYWEYNNIENILENKILSDLK